MVKTLDALEEKPKLSDMDLGTLRGFVRQGNKEQATRAQLRLDREEKARRKEKR